ncbi:MAG: hypothetical protein JWO45_1282 [Spartobacteria bacterium]|nr:hypothetical protein [Spartobacteria bacterium]
MKVHLKQIRLEGLHLEGQEDCPLVGLEKQEIHCAGPLQYNLDIGISDGALWANGSLAQRVELQCVSCLQKFVYTIEVPAFALHMELPGPETIDLTPFAREDILLNLPAYPRCDCNGERVCPGPPIAKDPARSETLAAAPPEWSALDKLKIEEK